MKKYSSSRFESLESRLLFAAGDPDIAFNNSHISLTTFKAGGSHVNDVATLPDGGIVAVGQIQDNKKGFDEGAVAEYNFDGSLNTSFGSGGTIVGLPGEMTSPNQVQIGSDGSIYILDAGDSTMTKLTPAGAIDTKFGASGVLSVPKIQNVSGSFTLDSSNNILVAGIDLSSNDAVLRRYTSAGAIDPAFKGGSDFILGPVGTTETQAQYRTMTFGTPQVDAEGRILITAQDALHASHANRTIDVTNDYLYRITSAGKIDRTFGSAGNTKLADGTASIAGLLSNEEILIDTNNRLSRYNSDGTLDTKYGTNGVSTLDVTLGSRAGNGHAFAVAADGTVTVIGHSSDPDSNFAITHIQSNGTLDTDFGSNGIVAPTTLGQSFADGVTLAPDGTIVIGGEVGSLSPSGKVDTRTFAVARLYSGKGPALQLVPRTLKTKSRYLSMTVLIRDNETVKLSTLDNNDLKLFDSDGNTRKIRLLSSKQLDDDGRYIQATYRIVAPNNDATWLAADNGQYEVRLQKQQVADGNSNFAEAQILGTLGVKIV